MHKKIKIILILLLFSIAVLLFWNHFFEKTEHAYGVFLSIDGSETEKLQGYKTVVIDAQYFTQEQIAELKTSGCTVYSYLNVGALETFRDYYDAYADLILGNYDNWEEEGWIDVSDYEWQEQLASLSQEFLQKGIDGFFVDNCDVYYQYTEDKIYHGLCQILQGLRATGKDVIINGGDVFVQEYLRQNKELNTILSGINQECVFSSIDFKRNNFNRAAKEDKKYYLSYLENAEQHGAAIYLLEYTKNSELQEEIRDFCRKRNWNYAISDSIELD